METFNENRVNSGELSIETILIEELEITIQDEYTVTSSGLIKLDGLLVKIRKAGYKRKYSQVYLKTTPKHKGNNYFVHRLVAQAFLEKPEGSDQVNHIDGDPSNNDISNLEWVTPKGNMKHAYETGLSYQGESCPWAVNSEKYIRAICELLVKGFNNKEIRKALGTSPKLLWKIRHRKQWKSVSSEYDF